MIIKNFNALKNMALSKRGVRVVIAGGHDSEALKAADMAVSEGVAEVILVADRDKLLSTAEEIKVDISKFEVLYASDESEMAEKAVKLVKDGRAHAIMKGLVKTAIFLKAILNKEWGIKRSRLLSHVAIFEIPNYPKLIFLTDGGMVPYPTLDEKVQILQNALWVTSRLGYEKPKIAVLAAVETVNPKMQATIDAAALTVMSWRKQIDAIVDGPLALDNVLSRTAAEHKGIESPVIEDADIFLVPDIEAGNLLGKSFTYAAKGKMAGIVVGATVPVIVPSRADTYESKYFSLLAGIAMKEG